jgi:hypothetical protein
MPVILKNKPSGVPTQNLLEHRLDIWKCSFVRKTWKTGISYYLVNLSLCFAQHFWVQCHCEDEYPHRRDRLQKVYLTILSNTQTELTVSTLAIYIDPGTDPATHMSSSVEFSLRLDMVFAATEGVAVPAAYINVDLKL